MRNVIPYKQRGGVALTLAMMLAAAVLLAACSTGTAGSPPDQLTVVATVTPGSVAATLKDIAASDPALVRRTGRPQVVEFFAYWCTDCQHMYPVMHDLETSYAQKIDFLYINIDADNTKALQRDLTFSGLRPTIVFLDAKGQEVQRLVGVHTQEAVQPILDKLVAAG